MEGSGVAKEEIEALKAIWTELEDRPPIWNSPAIAVPVFPLGSAAAEKATRVTVVVNFNTSYPKVPPRLELESPRNLADEEVADLKRALVAKAAELSGMGMVMVHDLLVLTNDFLSDKSGPPVKVKGAEATESLFHKMQEETKRQRERRAEEERAEEKRQREEEARALQAEEAKGEKQWDIVREKLEKEERERATSLHVVGTLEGVIPEASGGSYLDANERGKGKGVGDAIPNDQDEVETSESDDDDWMQGVRERGLPPFAGNKGVFSAEPGEPKGWYRCQFKELENLGKGGFGTVVKVRNRVDRRLYAVKKVGLDPFDRETNRKIRREVTTISTLIHKNIVRYYQAWLEGGGGAYPEAVEEEHSDELPEEEDNHGASSTDNNDDDDDDRGEGGLGFFRTPSSSNARRLSKNNPQNRPQAGPQNTVALVLTAPALDGQDPGSPKTGLLQDGRKPPTSSPPLPINRPTLASARTPASAGLEARKINSTAHEIGSEFGGSIVDAGAGGVAGEDDVGGAVVRGSKLGRKAQRQVRKRARKQKLLLQRQGKGKGGQSGGAGGGVGELGRRGVPDSGGSQGNEASSGVNATRYAVPPKPTTTTAPARMGSCGTGSSSAGMNTFSTNSSGRGVEVPTGSLWAKSRQLHQRAGGATGAGSRSTSDDDPETAVSEDESSGGDNRAWSLVDSGGDQKDSDESWGSGGGDYQPAGNGKLVSDAEFFQYCGSPERARQASDGAGGHPPVPASWSSEDALMQLYEETRRGSKPATSLISLDQKPSMAAARTGSSFLPAAGVTGGLVAPRAVGAVGAVGAHDLLGSAPAGGTMGIPIGERQFLYIQMEYCENTLRHLIDHGELWKEEQRCWRLFRQMLEGVDFIHSKGIIHRDLTPPNVFLDGEENVKLGDFGLATSKKVRDKVLEPKRGLGASSDDESHNNASLPRRRTRGWKGWYNGRLELSGADGSVPSTTFPSVLGTEVSMSDTSQLTDGVGTGPYIAPEQGARSGQYNHKADMWSLGVILFEMLAPRFSTLMERAEVMTTLRNGGEKLFPEAFDERVPENAKKVIRWLLKSDADARPTAAELLSSSLLPPKLEVEATFLREALRVMGNPESESFQAIVKALLHQETAEHVEHWYDRESLKAVKAQIPRDASAVAFVCDGLRRVFETHGASPVAPPALRPKPPPSLAPPAAESLGLVHLLDDKGAVVTLPGNLTAPFARFVARSDLTRLKRYQIDRVFHAGGPGPSGQAKEMWEADFDIVASESSPATGVGGNLPFGVDDVRGGRIGADSFEVAEAEAVLVVSQVMGTFGSYLGPWFLRLGNVKMSQAILELCHVPQEARSMVTALLGKLARGSLTPAEAWLEVEEKGILSVEALFSIRPFLHNMGKDPLEALLRLETLVHRIPAVKSVMGLPSGGRRREITKKEAVRTKRSLRAFHEGRAGLLALVIGLGRLGLITLPDDEDKKSSADGRNSKGGAKVRGGGGGGKSSRRKRQGQGDRTIGDGPRTTSTDSRVGDRSDTDLQGSSAGRGGRTQRHGAAAWLREAKSVGGGDAGWKGMGRIGGELDVGSWEGCVCPSVVSLDLGLTQRQGNYVSGTIFQAVLVGGGSLAGTGGQRYSATVAEGGRYDDLVARHRYHLRSFSSKLSGASAVCAVGVRFAVEKIASSIVSPANESLSGAKSNQQYQHQHQRLRRTVDAVVCAGGGFEPQGLQERVLVAARLWAGGVRAEYLPTDTLVMAGAGRERGLEGVNEACSSAGIPFVVVVRPHTLVAKKAVKVLSVLEKGGGQLEVPLDKLAEYVADGLAALADPMSAGSTQRPPTGPGGGYHHGHHHSGHHSQHQHSASVSSANSSGVQARVALVDRGQPGLGSLEREKMNDAIKAQSRELEEKLKRCSKLQMSRHEYKTLSALARRIESLIDAAIGGPERAGSSLEEGPLVLATEASFAAVRSLSTAFMLYGVESKAVLEFVTDHKEKKFLRNLLTALQELDGGKRRVGKGQGKGGQSRQVFVYSLADELMDLVTLSAFGGSGILSSQGFGGANNKGGRGLR